MKHKFNSSYLVWGTILIVLCSVGYFAYKDMRIRNDNLFSSLSTNRLVFNNYLTNQTASASSKAIHFISIFVGATPTMQIKADGFTFKDGILTCRALDRDFYIIGSMHSIVIEEIKAGQTPITSYLNRPPPSPSSQQQEKQNENPTVIK